MNIGNHRFNHEMQRDYFAITETCFPWDHSKTHYICIALTGLNTKKTKEIQLTRS